MNRTVGMIAAAAATLGFAACARGDRQAVSDAAYAGMVLTTAVAKPDFAFPATDGRVFDFRRDTDGFVTLLFFGYASCPDVCPLHFATLASAFRELPADVTSRVKVVFVTTDPDRDSLPAIRRWLDNFDRRFTGLRGPLAEVNQALAALGFPGAAAQALPEGGYGVSHVAVIVAFTRDNLVRVLYPAGIQQQDWVHDLPLLVRDQGAGLPAAQ